ncbi:MAG: HYR domain-containing protein [Pseudomonadota bacterium]
MRLNLCSCSHRCVVLLFGALILSGCVDSESAVDEEGSNPGQGGGSGGGSTAPAALTASATPQSTEATGVKTLFSPAAPSVSGGDGNYTMSNDVPSDGFDLGTTTVTWSIADSSGASTTAAQAVTVADTTPPTLSQPAQLQAQMPAGGGPVQLTLTPPAASDLVDPNPSLVNDAPGAGFPLGTTVVTWTATDASGNSTNVSQMIVVTDATGGPVTLAAPANLSAEATAPTSMVALGMATASGGQGNLTIVNDAPAGGFPVGATTVTWTATDENGDTATDTQQVTINDTTPPAITAPAAVSVTQMGDPTAVTLGDATATDIADVAPTISNDAPVGGFPVGTTTVTWTATDASGNSATATQTVFVEAAVACSTLVPEFAAEVYPVLDKPATCGNCHTPNNVVGTANGFNLLANDQAAFDLFRAIANIQIGGESSITVKALGGGGHGGGNRFAALGDADPDYIVIRDFVAEVTSCQDTVTTTSSALSTGTDYEQVYKITMGLGDRPPSSAEVASVESATDSAAKEVALAAVADQVMNEEAFYARLMEIYNDALLTDGRMNDSGRIRNIFDVRRFANEDYYESFDGARRRELRRATNYGIARAPIELIRYIVENDRPFSEVLTADYMMVNPYSAVIYGVDGGDPTFPFSFDQIEANHDRDDFRPVSTLLQSNEGNRPVPLTGVLSTHSWLEKHQTTATNVNRHRAAAVYLDFLGVDIEGLAPRDGLDLTNVVGDVPTVEDPQCTVCHDIMDPIAGLFKNRHNRGEYRGDVTWEHERTTNGVPRMLPPGYTMATADQLPQSEEAAALPWLGARLVEDPRFAKTTARTLLTGLTGIEPTQPATVTFLNDVATDFVDNGYDLKRLIRNIALSDYFLAKNVVSGENPADFIDFGHARLLTPEELERKIEALIGNGYTWNGPNSNGGLTGTFKLVYGGINSRDVEVRTTEPNALIDGVQKRIAQQVPCERVALELNGAPGNLFPHVSLTDTPDTAAAEIRENIAYLHRYLLGEDLLPTSTEVAATYQLFLAVRAMNETAITSSCRGGGAATDDNGTVLPWMAVLTYLLSDYDFLYD